MPTYSARCPTCQTEVAFVRKIDDRDDTPVCEHDGAKTERFLTATMVPRMGIADHYKITSASGQTFYGSGDYKKHLKANGLAPASELKGEAEHQKKAQAVTEKTQRREQLADIARTYT